MPWGLSAAHIVILLVILLVPVGAAVLIAAAVIRTAASPQRPAGPPVDDALASLRLRYARGEISEAEFEQMKRTLSA
jgi:uncharacterized membrane protein